MGKWADFLKNLAPKARKRRAKAQPGEVETRNLRHGGGQGGSARRKQQKPKKGAGEKRLFDSARKAPGKDLLDVLAAQRADEISEAEASGQALPPCADAAASRRAGALPFLFLFLLLLLLSDTPLGP